MKILVVIIFIGAHIFLAKPAITTFSPTYDEPVHLTAGYVYWKTGDYRYNGYHHPAFGEMWAALPLVFMKPLLPAQHPAWIAHRWTARDQYNFADVFLYKNRVPADRMMSAGRAMQLALSCVLGVMIFLCAFSLGGFLPALFAGIFWSFSPAFLSNGTIISTDLAFAVFFFGFFASLLRFGDERFDAAAGVSLGLAFASKYFALSVLPIVGLLLIWDKRLRGGVKSWLIVAGAAALTLAVVYRFSSLDVFVGGLREIFSRSQAGRSSFFNGQHGTQGWLLYFPYVFLVKTPLPLLAAVAAMGIAAGLKKVRVPAVLWLPPVLFFAAASISKVQIGHRHLLAIYPFLFVIAALGLMSLSKKAWIPAFAGMTAVLWLGFQTTMTRPHFLAYFNEVVGGPSKGYLHLTDSNVDWGQGLAPLAAALSEQDKKDGIFLSYFGVADPRHYGIRYLDIGSDRIVERVDDSALALTPTKFAISVTNLQGTYYADHAAFEWLKAYEPAVRVAHSIFLYDFSNRPEALARLRAMRS